MDNNFIPAHFVRLENSITEEKPWSLRRQPDPKILSNLGKIMKEILLTKNAIFFHIDNRYLAQIQNLFLSYDLKLQVNDLPFFKFQLSHYFKTYKQNSTILYLDHGEGKINWSFKTEFVPNENYTVFNGEVPSILKLINNTRVVRDDIDLKLSKIASDIGEIYLSTFFYNKSTTENKFLLHPLSELHWINCYEKYDINILNQINIEDKYKPYFKNILMKLRAKFKDEDLTPLIDNLNDYQRSHFYPFDSQFYYGSHYINYLIEEEMIKEVIDYVKENIKYLPFIIDNPTFDYENLYQLGKCYLTIEHGEPDNPKDHNIMRNQIKVNYYMAQMLLSDLKPSKYEIIIQHLMNSYDYLDSRELRSKLFHQWYFNEPFSNDFSIDVNLETIINIAKKIRLKYVKE